MRLVSHFRALVLAHIIAIVAPTGGLYTSLDFFFSIIFTTENSINWIALLKSYTGIEPILCSSEMLATLFFPKQSCFQFHIPTTIYEHGKKSRTKDTLIRRFNLEDIYYVRQVRKMLSYAVSSIFSTLPQMWILKYFFSLLFLLWRCVCVARHLVSIAMGNSLVSKQH